MGISVTSFHSNFIDADFSLVFHEYVSWIICTFSLKGRGCKTLSFLGFFMHAFNSNSNENIWNMI